jgi:hypothetical protein
MQTCITTCRNDRLVWTLMSHRPWAVGLARLLRERSLENKDLLPYGLSRSGTISDVLHQPHKPSIATLQQLCQVFTAYDRRDGNVHALAVELWEFFVSDEQAKVLRTLTAQQAALLKPAEPTPEEKEFQQFLKIKQWQAQQAADKAEPPVKKKKHA